FRPELREVAARLVDVCRRTGLNRHPDPLAVLGRAWNVSVEDHSLAEEGYREDLQRRWCWLHALLQAGEADRQQLARFGLSYRSRECRGRWELLEGGPELAAARIEQGILGLADEIEERMPERLLAAGKGQLRVEWQESSGWLDGRYAWEGDKGSRPLALCRA